MVNGLILSFSPESLILRVQDGEQTIEGSWLFELSSRIVLIGQDNKNRIEVFTPFEVFESLKNDRFFVSKAEQFLRRIRTTKRDELGRLLYSQYSYFDNDLDS